VQSQAKTVEEYLASLPEDRREAIAAVRKVILENLGPGYEEGMQYGMIGYYVPHSVYPPGYHCDPKQPLPFAALASQKNHMAVYLGCVYGDAEQEGRFREEWARTGKKLDMGKSCVRFKRLADLALDVIGKAIQRTPASLFVASYEAVRAGGRAAARKAPGKKSPVKKAPGKKNPPKKAPGKKSPAKKAPGRKAPPTPRARPVGGR
jgi:hypothetical protein